MHLSLHIHALCLYIVQLFCMIIVYLFARSRRARARDQFSEKSFILRCIAISLPAGETIKVSGYKTSNDRCTIYFWWVNTLARTRNKVSQRGSALLRAWKNTLPGRERALADSRANCDERRLRGANRERRENANENHKSATNTAPSFRVRFLIECFSRGGENACALLTATINDDIADTGWRNLYWRGQRSR